MSFSLVEEQKITEINSTAGLYRHDQTGARLLSLINQDENKVFGISFRTPPRIANGIAHILEHVVLAGSRKYPVRDPFIELAKGSLKTFLNAFTFPDKTCYPVASQNVKDLYNLADVYMDAVLHPLIDEMKFRQEGWHLEPGDTPEEIKFNGIVYNEMKGAYSSPDDLINNRYSQYSLYPDTPYGINSGGDPLVIPDLTYEEFREFHRSYYHPSNAYIYFYGNDDPEQRLRFIEGWLEGYSAQLVSSALPLQPPFAVPRRLRHVYDSGGNADARSYLTVNWLLPQTGDPQTMLGFAILTHLLTATPASPLRKALIDSGLGEELAGAGLEDSLRQMFFSTGLKGIRQENLDRVEALILETLRHLADNGIDPDTVAASLNTVEFQLREKSDAFLPRGLVIMLSALTAWLHDADPLAVLAFERPLQVIKERQAGGGRHFEGLIRQYLLENPHRTTVTLEPDPGEGRRRADAERGRLAQIRSGLSVQGVESIARAAEELKRMQSTPDSPEALATIPMLQLADLDRTGKVIPLEIRHAAEPTILFHDIPTNGIVYLDVGFDLHPLPSVLLPFIGLFGRILLEMGTQTQDYINLTQRIGRATGGISSETLASAVRSSPEAALWFFLRGKVVTAQAGELLAILKDVLLTARFDDRQRFRQIVLEEKGRVEALLHARGHRFVNRRLRAGFHLADQVAEQVGGLEYLFFLRQLALDLEKDWDSILEKLEKVRRLLINQHTLLVNLTAEAPVLEALHPQIADLIHVLPALDSALTDLVLAPITVNEGFSIPGQVNYVGKGGNLYAMGIQPHGSIRVINNYLSNTWLYKKVRLQGGAYGGFSQFDPASGSFTFLSYRDPNLLTTLENYDQSPRFLETLEMSDSELTKAIIGAIGDIDAYLLPDARGWASMADHLTGFTREVRQHIRDQVLGIEVKDFRQFSRALEQVARDGKIVVIGSPEAIKQANQEHTGLLEMKILM